MTKFLAAFSYALAFGILFGAIAGPKDSLLHSGDMGAMYRELGFGCFSVFAGTLWLISALRAPNDPGRDK